MARRWRRPGAEVAVKRRAGRSPRAPAARPTGQRCVDSWCSQPCSAMRRGASRRGLAMAAGAWRRGATILATAWLALVATPPAVAQFSQSYNFIDAVKDRDATKAKQILDKPGSTAVNTLDGATG